MPASDRGDPRNGKDGTDGHRNFQEGSNSQVIEQIALMSKMAGADIQHIGDAGYGGIALPENIMALSVAIRGKRHTYRRMGYSMRK